PGGLVRDTGRGQDASGTELLSRRPDKATCRPFGGSYDRPSASSRHSSPNAWKNRSTLPWPGAIVGARRPPDGPVLARKAAGPSVPSGFRGDEDTGAVPAAARLTPEGEVVSPPSSWAPNVGGVISWQSENAEVLLSESVAVAAMNWPGSTAIATVKVKS